MIKKQIVRAGLALLAASTVMMTGCGKKKTADTGKDKVYVVVKASASEFWQIVLDGAKTAGKDLGVEVVSQAPVSETQIEKQVGIFENAISSRPKAIVVAPIVSDSLTRGIKKAAKRNIPVVVIDSKANTDMHTAYLASDNYKIGVIAADKMAEGLKKKYGEISGKVAGLTFRSGAASLELRKQGFIDQMKKKYPKVQVLDFKDAQGKSQLCIDITQNLISGNPDLRGIYANNQQTGDGAVRALETSGKKKLVTIVVDAGQNEQKGLREGLVDAMIVQRPWMMGYMGVEYAVKAVRGEKLDFDDADLKRKDTGVIAITTEMMNNGSAEEFLNPVEFRKKNLAAK